MQQQPPNKPPVVDYRTVSNEPRNTPKTFFARMAIGGGLGVAGCIMGGALYGATNNFFIAAIPICVALAVTVTIGLRQRKYGYVTGVILAPFLIVVCLFLLLLAICGLGR